MPPDPAHLLHQAAYGPTPALRQEFLQLGAAGWVESQLYPTAADEPQLAQKLASLTMPIEYAHRGRKVKENRKLSYLGASLPQLWALNQEDVPYQEKIRPAEEVVAATCLRAVYSRWQLQERMVEFWHNHFSVSVHADLRIALALPLYDREAIRPHVFGNFRQLLGAVAQSQAMLYYLDNVHSKASPANENFARELFELHTLGAKHYYNHLYNRWREVPGALQGTPIGYIDEDVYEASRAFTGWTVADGAYNEKGGHLPNTGQFLYFDAWHDSYQKRVLGTEFAPNRPAQADGQQVLDLVAYHPATAQHLCHKLCQRLVADVPPPSLVAKAVATWTAHQRSPDQVRQVLRTILLAPETAQSAGQKIKRPYELVMGYLRGIGAEVSPNPVFFYLLGWAGQPLFQWPTPTGPPDTASHWLGTNLVLARWNLLQVLTLHDWTKAVQADLPAQVPPSLQSCQALADFWADRLFARPVPEAIRQRAMNYLAAGGSEDEPPQGSPEEVRLRHAQMVALLAMSPDYQYR
jgi:uncharacterized protein (DUF1800 family)